MFPWRRRNDGFEWREYVRTTILLRRGDRRRRVEEAKQQAFGVARKSSLQGAEAVQRGAVALGHNALALLWWLLALPGRALGALLPLLGPPAAAARDMAGAALCRIAAPLEPAFEVLRGRRIRIALIATFLISGAGVAQRLFWHGYDQEVVFAASIAAISGLLIAIPAYAAGFRMHLWHRISSAASWIGQAARRLPVLERMSPFGAVVSLVAALWLAGWGAWHVASGSAQLPGFPDIASALSPAPPAVIEGRAEALAGDTIRIGRQTVRLAAIEAPEREQVCIKSTSVRWRCGDAARNALDKIVRGRRVVCTPTGDRTGDVVLADCRSGEKDIAAELVEQGYVFLTDDAPSAFSALEVQAQTAKIGLWAGEADRPDRYRAKRWNEAKLAAPEGCPIKGQVVGRDRIYHLPWSPAYERVKLRSQRGDRWFCTEEEARAAGWRATSRS